MGKLTKQIWLSYEQGDKLIEDLKELETHIIESRFNENAKERSEEFKKAMRILGEITTDLKDRGNYIEMEK